VKIIVINLKKFEDRKYQIIRQMELFGIEDYEFFDAVDGNQLSEDFISTIYDDNLCNQILGRSLTKYEIGIALSHRNVYYKILDKPEEQYIILEDDAIFDNRFSDFIKGKFLVPDDVDILYLGYYIPENLTKKNTLREKRKSGEHPLLIHNDRKKINGIIFFKLKENIPIYQIHGYIITNKGCEKIINNNDKIYITADDLFFHIKLNLYLPIKSIIQNGSRIN
jgi:GR25 family glycosyltransferase involved in LPS biosynthesis